MEPELAGEDFSVYKFHSTVLNDTGAGRPPQIYPDTLRRNVEELQFLLEQNWGVVGWLLSQAKTESDIRTAFRSIVNPRCRLLEPFIKDHTQCVAADLRALRDKVKQLGKSHRRHLLDAQNRQSVCERLFGAWVEESDPVVRVKIHNALANCSREYEEVASLEEKSRATGEMLRAELSDSEAHFAQSEILAHIQSGRRRFTPLNVARAMAGLPLVSSRISSEKCRASGINPPNGIAFGTFRLIERTLKEPLSDLGHSLESLRNLLVSGPEKDLPHGAELRKNWYFLSSAVRVAACQTRAPYGSFAFRIFAEYSKLTGSQTELDAVLAETHSL